MCRADQQLPGVMDDEQEGMAVIITRQDEKIFEMM